MIFCFGDKILNGDFSIDGGQSRYASGTNIVKFPCGGYVHSFSFLDASESGATQNILSSDMTMVDMPMLIASHWLVPAIVTVSGLVLLLSFWRIRQKRRRRRKGSGSSHLANL